MTTYDTELIMRAVAITGTRSTGHRSLDEYARLFADYLGPFAHGAHFYIGGAKGIDSLSLLWLAGNTAAYITVVTPGTVDQQPAEARQAIARTRERIKEVVELGAPELKTPAYHARNRWMVDPQPHDDRLPTRRRSLIRDVADTQLHSRSGET